MKKFIIGLLFCAVVGLQTRDALAQEINATLFYTPRIETATGKPYGFVGLRPDRRSFAYVLDTTPITGNFLWRRIPKPQLADTPMSIAQGASGITAEAVMMKLDSTANPFWLERTRTLVKARAQLVLIKSNIHRIPWPPFDPSQGETE